jgi:hypothetical protein
MSNEFSLYPLFDEITGDFLFRPAFPAPPYPTYVSLDQLRDYVAGFPNYTLVVPTNGQTLNVPSIDKYIMNPAGALASLTLRLPIVLDKRNIRLATRQRIDALTITGLGGAAVDWIVTELPQYGAADFTYISSLNVWARV